MVNPVWRPWRTYQAPVLAALGRDDEARALMAEEVALARDWGAPSVLGRTLRVAGELGGPGSPEMLREAYDLLLPSVARFELACAELALARVTADAGGAGAAAARGAGPGRRLRLAGALRPLLRRAGRRSGCPRRPTTATW